MQTFRQLLIGQFSIRFLLLLAFLVAIACVGWQWWQSTSEWRELRHAIQTDATLSVTEKRLYTRLIYDEKMKEAVSALGLRRQSENQVDISRLRLAWEDSCSDRHVFVFSSWFFRPKVELIILTDSEFRPLDYASAGCRGALASANVQHVDGEIELCIIADTTGLHRSDESRGKYRYILGDKIHPQAVEWLPRELPSN